ncbi:PKD domain-containing protein [Flavobacterium gawalongense]|uniref:PKD domain-containing protein n=1 Tax=Flavobacterium gawalongense TaxID=2594432 RepID=A0A553BDB8_9FLAO|nr:PKD domain-containing protein [Flavobacterium gawalongense]TRX01330.1 PKD domain-containing protein [Flavobacterium gawalongense]TRX05854.1 PKD domain-containing protein [Flavobacterium gawalongense]TRX06240.1 PKD domain-containing protein [Flavobacterium gawalongense]TRX06984.1 PKD domain-containing protein [Flavobacterium gawalongense]TRX23127.1 PKD domain-containing protein [Flavobacterium gawalongense]
MKPTLFFLLFLTSFLLYSQTKVKDTITRRANIGYDQKGNLVTFKPETPPLIPIAGAPKPSYSYLWEMGDGHYSKQVEPKHVYKTKGTYTARLTVTNNYDNGKPPATRPKKVAVNEIPEEIYKDIASIEDQNGFSIQKNCDPIPEQEMVVILSYQNMENYVSNGKLYLFYNEKQFKNNNFELMDLRTHAGEREIKENIIASVNDLENSNSYLASSENLAPAKKHKITTTEEDLDATLLEANKTYNNVSILEFDDSNPGETRTIFYTFKTTPEMIKDTSAIVTMRGIFVPNRNFKNHKIKNLEMEIVTSHDPNKMGSNGSFMNYRLVRFKRVKFKTRFQNNGEGPARMIRLETDIPEMFDKKTFQIEDMYPQCPICPKGEIPTTSCLDTIVRESQIFFIFRNIYLPGSNQKNVKEIDSTKGFVKYSMKFNEDFHKIKTKSRTAIIFDKNEPILTNYATTRFLPGISIGVKAGYNVYPSLENSKSYFVGATLSPFKSYRYYGQAEFLNSVHTYDDKVTVRDEINQSTGNVQLQRMTTTVDNKNINWEVPVLFRYNLNNYFGIGAGIQVNINVSESKELTLKTETFEGTSDKFLLRTEYFTNTASNTFTDVKTGFVLDFTGGFARIGPSLGARYIMNFKDNFNYFQFYGIWKF